LATTEIFYKVYISRK